MTAAHETTVLPTSAIQEQMWLNEVLRGADNVYTVAEALRIGTRLEPSGLQRAVRALQERHPALRTTFDGDADGVRQVIHRSYPVPLLTFPMAAGDGDAEFQLLLDQVLQRPFDLTRPPLWRCVTATAGDQSYLAVVLHHIVADGVSLSLLLDEFGTLYSGAALGAPPPAYSDFSAAQREWLTSAEASESRRYWREELAGAPSVTTFPAPWNRTSHRGRRSRFPVPGELRREAEKVALAEGATPFMVFLAVYAVLLAHRSGRRDLVVGVPGANRVREEYLRTVGLFVNPLPVRIRLGPDPTLREAVPAVRDALLGAVEHQELPFSAIAGIARQERAGARRPLVQVMVAERSGQPGTVSFAGHRAHRLVTSTGTAKYDVLATFPGAVDDETGLVMEFDLGRYDDRYIHRLGQQYLQVLRQMLASPATARSPRPAGAPPAGFPSLPQRFRRIAARQPERIAIVQGDRWCTYAELDERSSQIALSLRQAGVARGSVAGLQLGRGPDFVASALAVLKLGAAYLPIDERWPGRRVRQVLADSAAAVLIVNDEGQVPSSTAGCARVLALAAVPRGPVAPGAVPDVRVRPDDLAIVIYTSGSTGEPKGVMVECGSAVRLLDEDQPCAVRDDDRVAQHANLAFDAATYEIWGALTTGATLVVPPPGNLGPAEYADLFTGSTVSFITAGLFSELMQQPACRAAVRALRLLIVGGDVVDPASLAAVSRPGQVRLNGFGPTETTTFATLGQLDERTTRGTVPIGAPLSGVWCYLLDENLDPVGAGQEGELFIGGAGVSRGYLGHPGLTAEKFRPDPRHPGARVYATGDWVQRDAHGTLDFLGRRDHQVKVHGFRVELGEIEAVLRAEPLVQSARVVPDGSGAADRRLVAVVQAVPGAGGDDLGQRLRATLAAKLPPYLQPDDLIVTEHLPLTPNGKVDLTRLISRVQAAPAAPPGHPAVSRMAAVWQQVLKVPAGGSADFFALGGNSLTVLRLLVKVEEEYGVALTPQEVFDTCDLPGFTDMVLEHAGRPTPAPTRPPLGRTARPSRIPLSYAQRRLWFLNRLEDTGAAYNFSVAFRIRGPLDRAALVAAVDDVVARHETLRTTFPEHDGVPSQNVLPGGSGRPVLTTRDADERDIAGTLARDAGRPFDLTAGPPMRSVLYRLGPASHVLLVVIHHIAVDGLSVTPLTRDLATAYTARRVGREPGWDPLPIQYADHSLWQQDWLGDEDDPGSPISRQRRFWAETLRGLPVELGLPVDRPRPPVARHRGARVPVMVSPDVYRGLTAIAARSGTTLYMVLHAGLAALLSRIAASTDIPVGTPVAGRAEAVTDDLIGFFVNTLVLRADTSGDPAFRELVTRVRSADLAAYAHQDLPFERVVDALNPPRSLARHPLFQVMFALQPPADVRLDLAGLETSREPTGLAAVRFDLGFYLTERPRAGLDGYIEYDTDLFDRATVQGMADSLTRLLAAAVTDPDRPISLLDPPPGPEDRGGAVRPCAAPVPPSPVTLPAMFAEQARRTPDAIAVRSPAAQLSYADLAARTARLAARLTRLGVGPGVLVGVYAERGPQLLEALLGVLAAGGAYLPLEPGQPAARLSWMLTDSRAAAVLVQPGLEKQLPEPGIRQLALDETAGPGADSTTSGADPARSRPAAGGAAPADLAYVIYTSGSTGEPKGVMITHEGLAGYLSWCVRELGDAAAHGSLVHSPLGFDFTVTSLYCPLLTGGCVELLPGGAGLAGLAGELGRPDRPPLGLLRLTPSHVDALQLHFAGTGQTIRARAIVVGGEELTTQTAVALRGLAPGAVLYNHYGPSETVVGRCVYRLPAGREPAAADRTVPIGRPIPGTRAYLLGADLRPVRPGTQGELFLGGPGLARGYLGRPALTADRFGPDPFAGGGARMYRTGDLARRNATGELEFQGRTDDQVKIRGYRVEPEEARVALAAQPGVAQAAVVSREEQPGHRILAGYVVPRGDTAGLDGGRLRSALAGQLPDYLVPSAVVVVDQLPLTDSGKLDRRALPAPRPAVPAGGRPPATPVEAMLCTQFARTLDLDSVGPDDNFFDLGGNSLLSVRLVSALRRRTGTELPLSAIFEAQTAAALANVLERGGEASPGDPASAPVLDPSIRAGTAARVPAQRVRAPRRVLLTGATGFLGAFLLRAILDRTDAEVVCLVRAPGATQAYGRIEHALRGYLLWDDALAGRIVPLPGRLDEPLLDLPAARFAELSGQLDAVYHCGAQVNVVASYRHLEAANVRGTGEIIRLATQARTVPVHYVSTVSTLIARTGNPALLTEDRRVSPEAVSGNGYVRSKWAGEELVRAAQQAGVPTSVYRPGRVSGHSVTGAAGADDAFWHYVRACIEIGAVPKRAGRYSYVNFVPVDYVASAIVQLAHQRGPEGTAYNLVSESPTSLSFVIEQVREAGYRVDTVEPAEWLRRLSEAAAQAGTGPASSVATVALMEGGTSGQADPPVRRFGRRNAETGLSGSDVACPPVDRQVLRRYVGFLAESGFLPPAPRPTRPPHPEGNEQ